MNRNSLSLWLIAGGALVTFLLADGRPPTAWAYTDWLKFAATAVAWGTGKLQSSPLKGRDE